MKILHIMNESAFTIFTQKVFNDANRCGNAFRVFSINNIELGSIHELNSSFKIIDKRYINSPQMREDLCWCDILIIHNMTKNAADLIKLAPETTIIVWSGWGSDYGSILRHMYAGAVLPQTRQFISDYSGSLKSLYRFAKRNGLTYLRRAINPSHTNEYWLNKILHRIDYFSGFQDAYDAISARFDDFLAFHIEGIKYCSVEDVYSRGENEIHGNNILVGHAAFPSVNQIDTLHILKDINIKGRKIIAPLSYGDKEYRKHLIDYGTNLFGEDFLALTDFMELDEYHNIISSCAVIIINSVYDQAFGTVSTGLYKGSKIYIRGDGNIFNYYRKKGAHLFDARDIARHPHSMFCELSVDMKVRNKNVIESIWSYNAIVSELKNAMETIRQREKLC